MTDKEFIELLMLYQEGRVPSLDVGLALANNQFGREALVLASNILTKKKASSRVGRPQTISSDVKNLIVRLRTEGMTLETIAQQVRCSLSTVRRTLEKYQQALG